MIALAKNIAGRRSRAIRRRSARKLLDVLREPTRRHAAELARAAERCPSAFPLVITGQGEYARHIYGDRS